MKDKSKLVAIFLAVTAILVVVISSILGNVKKEELNNKKYIVTNYSNFYTVNSCLYRVITYLASQNANNMMLVLNEKYKEKNNVTESDVLNLFPQVEPSSNFVSIKMYYENISKNIKKYYVEGYIKKNQLIDGTDTNNEDQALVYFIVYLDYENKVFSIEPYSGDIFMDGELNEK